MAPRKTPQKDAYLEVTTPRPSAASARGNAAAKVPHPIDRCSWLTTISLFWLLPLLRRGYRAPLHEDDVWALPRADQAEAQQVKFDAAWEAKAHRAAKPVKHFLAALWQATLVPVLSAVTVLMVANVLSVVQPLLIKAILQRNVGPAPPGQPSGYVLAAVLACVALLNATCVNGGVFLTLRAGCNARTIAVRSVFAKVLRMSGTARRAQTHGHVVTLVTVDSERVLEAYNVGIWAVVAPAHMVMVVVLLAIQTNVAVGMAALVTIIVVLVGGVWLARSVGSYHQRIVSVTAERVKLTNEVLLGIRALKLYGWEQTLQERLARVRAEEVALMATYNNVRHASAVLMLLAPILINAVCFLVYVLMGHTLDIPTAFVVFALTNATKMPFTIFANATINLYEGVASAKRIAEFVTADANGDLVLGTKTLADASSSDEITQPLIEIHDGTFQWLVEQDTPTLSDINLELAPGSFTVIVGAVGSGKSSLVHALLGEMHQQAGSRIFRTDAIAFASQQPWLQQDTLRNNILFGDDLDAGYYDQVVATCQLRHDLDLLQDGDDTELGERGVTLSGGQKARVGLARALYRARRTDLVVLDDPLSALDVRVANAVFTDALCGLARNKTRVLVLNAHYHLLPQADRILVLENGRIVGDGAFAQLQAEFPLLGQSPEQADDTEGDHETSNANRKSITAEAEPMGEPEAEEGNSDAKSSPSKLVQEEERLVGGVSAKTYVDYLSHSGWHGVVTATAVLLLFLLAQSALFLVDWYMAKWADGSIHWPQKTTAGVYWAIVFAAGGFAVVRSVFYTAVCMRCSLRLHNTCLHKVLHAPVPTFFDVTPLGRIINRISRDLDQMDNPFPFVSYWFLSYGSHALAAFVVCAATNAWILAVYVPVLAIFIFIANFYQASARELKRMDGTARSPLLSLLSETLDGVETIRALGRTAHFTSECARLLDAHGKVYFAFHACGRWFAMRADWLVAVVIGAVAFLSVHQHSTTGTVLAGLALTYSAQLTSFFQRTMTLYTLTESLMTSFERIQHYHALKQEEDPATTTTAPPPEWPSAGALEFKGVSLRYRADLPLVLDNVSFTIASGEFVGVCGRTGAGKSSLVSVLFRLVNISEGRVLLDGVDLATLPLQVLRSQLTVIPQDPMLLSGSLRMNLDPMDAYDDDALWSALRRVHMSDTIAREGHGLDFHVAEHGGNLSVGQRQLLCIARALLRQSRVVVMDEATANIDGEADKLIQCTVHEAFGRGDTTMLCIAHRLDTIMQSDKILVLDSGRVQEFDTPAALLAKPDGMFQQLVASSH